MTHTTEMAEIQTAAEVADIQTTIAEVAVTAEIQTIAEVAETAFA